ncbi:UDP-N-acetylglucosamine--dolichyl-phosphate N-acetylglucosaminephosphotransferase [Thermococcus profundus]|uniref:UDP-N-acetylglucosamine--dolichyl-phosphate N-acetylglucosaminephosphotransferase n=2 Tax=Thermococcus profundus TaxID=49899 RepID=A0A2Z2M844_THEPR|nr:DUF2304 family protein [Thermococcus profundus]ASJ02630.1 UDP-N-acetylglucosamine--dolichyl-phosphate N-acetylglucosaminephosphotransferase [Thermococcus profundus]
MYMAQIVALVVIGYLLVKMLNDYRQGRIDWSGVISWLVIFTVFGLIALFPLKVSMEIKDLLGLGRGLDALFVVSIGLIFLLMFQLYVEIDRTKREITELTRKVAIELEEINEKLEKIEKKG